MTVSKLAAKGMSIAQMSAVLRVPRCVVVRRLDEAGLLGSQTSKHRTTPR